MPELISAKEFDCWCNYALDQRRTHTGAESEYYRGYLNGLYQARTYDDPPSYSLSTAAQFKRWGDWRLRQVARLPLPTLIASNWRERAYRFYGFHDGVCRAMGVTAIDTTATDPVYYCADGDAIEATTSRIPLLGWEYAVEKPEELTFTHNFRTDRMVQTITVAFSVLMLTLIIAELLL